MKKNGPTDLEMVMQAAATLDGMKDLERVETTLGGYATRGWLKRKKRHGLWIVESPGKFTLTIYYDGVEQAQDVIFASDPAPFPITALFDKLKASQARRDDEGTHGRKEAAKTRARKK